LVEEKRLGRVATGPEKSCKNVRLETELESQNSGGHLARENDISDSLARRPTGRPAETAEIRTRTAALTLPGLG